MTIAAALAARTRRVRIGTAVLIAPLRPTVQIAEDASIRIQDASDVPSVEAFLWASIAGMPSDLARRHVELLCRDVLPAVRDLELWGRRTPSPPRSSGSSRSVTSTHG